MVKGALPSGAFLLDTLAYLAMLGNGIANLCNLFVSLDKVIGTLEHEESLHGTSMVGLMDLLGY